MAARGGLNPPVGGEVVGDFAGIPLQGQDATGRPEVGPFGLPVPVPAGGPEPVPTGFMQPDSAEGSGGLVYDPVADAMFADALAEAVLYPEDHSSDDFGSISLDDDSDRSDPADPRCAVHEVATEDPETRPSQIIYLHDSSGSVRLTVDESFEEQKTTLRMAATFVSPPGGSVGRAAQLRLIVVAVDLMLVSTAGMDLTKAERLVRMKSIISAYGLQPDEGTVSEVVSLIQTVRSSKQTTPPPGHSVAWPWWANSLLPLPRQTYRTHRC